MHVWMVSKVMCLCHFILEPGFCVQPVTGKKLLPGEPDTFCHHIVCCLVKFNIPYIGYLELKNSSILGCGKNDCRLIIFLYIGLCFCLCRWPLSLYLYWNTYLFRRNTLQFYLAESHEMVTDKHWKGEFYQFTLYCLWSRHLGISWFHEQNNVWSKPFYFL